MGTFIDKNYLQNFWKDKVQQVPIQEHISSLETNAKTVVGAINELKNDLYKPGYGIEISDDKTITAEVKYIQENVTVKKISSLQVSPYESNLRFPEFIYDLDYIWYANGDTYYSFSPSYNYKLVGNTWLGFEPDSIWNMHDYPIDGYETHVSHTGDTYWIKNSDIYKFVDNDWILCDETDPFIKNLYDLIENIYIPNNDNICHHFWTDGITDYISDDNIQYKLTENGWVDISDTLAGKFWPQYADDVWYDEHGNVYALDHIEDDKGAYYQLYKFVNGNWEICNDITLPRNVNYWGRSFKVINGSTYLIVETDVHEPGGRYYTLVDNKFVEYNPPVINGAGIWKDDKNNIYYSESESYGSGSGSSVQYKLTENGWVSIINEIQDLYESDENAYWPQYGADVWYDENGNIYSHDGYQLVNGKWISSSIEYPTGLAGVYNNLDGVAFGLIPSTGDSQDGCRVLKFDGTQWVPALPNESYTIIPNTNNPFYTSKIVGEFLLTLVYTSDNAPQFYQFNGEEWSTCEIEFDKSLGYDVYDYMGFLTQFSWTDSNGDILLSDSDGNGFKCNLIRESDSKIQNKYITNHNDELQTKFVDYYKGSTTTTSVVKPQWFNFDLSSLQFDHDLLPSSTFWEDAQGNVFISIRTSWNSSSFDTTYLIKDDTLLETSIDNTVISDFQSQNVWIDKLNGRTFYSNDQNQYELIDNEWQEISAPSIWPQTGRYVWYFKSSNNSLKTFYDAGYDEHYELINGEWRTHQWTMPSLLGSLYGDGIWYANDNIYFCTWQDGYGNLTFKLDLETSTWTRINLDIWAGDGKVWHHNGKTYLTTNDSYHNSDNDDDSYNFEFKDDNWVFIDWTPTGLTPMVAYDYTTYDILWSNIDEDYVITVASLDYGSRYHIFKLGEKTVTTTATIPNTYKTIYNDLLQTKLYDSPSIRFNDNVVELRTIYGGKPLTTNQAQEKLEEFFPGYDEITMEDVENGFDVRFSDLTLFEEIGYYELPIDKLASQNYPPFAIHASFNISDSNKVILQNNESDNDDDNEFRSYQDSSCGIFGTLHLHIQLTYETWRKQYYISEGGDFYCTVSNELLQDLFVVTFNPTSHRVTIYFNKIWYQYTIGHYSHNDEDYVAGHFIVRSNDLYYGDDTGLANVYASQIALTSISPDSKFIQGNANLITYEQILNDAGTAGSNSVAIITSVSQTPPEGYRVHSLKINDRNYLAKSSLHNPYYERANNGHLNLGRFLKARTLISHKKNVSNRAEDTDHPFWSEVGFLTTPMNYDVDFDYNKENEIFDGITPSYRFSITFAVHYVWFWEGTGDYNNVSVQRQLSNESYGGYLTIDFQKSTYNGNIEKINCHVSNPALEGMFKVTYEPDVEADSLRPNIITYNNSVIYRDQSIDVHKYIKLYAYSLGEGFCWGLTQVTGLRDSLGLYFHSSYSDSAYNYNDSYEHMYSISELSSVPKPENGIITTAKYIGNNSGDKITVTLKGANQYQGECKFGNVTLINDNTLLSGLQFPFTITDANENEVDYQNYLLTHNINVSYCTNSPTLKRVQMSNPESYLSTLSDGTSVIVIDLSSLADKTLSIINISFNEI